MATNWNKWEVTRSKGPVSFVLLRGALGWGVPVAILWSLLMWLVSPDKHLPTLLVLAIIIFPLGGVIWGVVMWFVLERMYVRSKQSNEP